MIPEFPFFKSLEPSDKETVLALSKKFLPYSDFNPTSMWSWDVTGTMGISILNGNLVVKFADYLTNKPFYSFIGTSDVSDTAEKLLELSIREGLEPKLKLLPGEAVRGLNHIRFKAEEDRDNFDYILDNADMIEYKSHDLRTQRGQKKAFIDAYGAEISVRVLDIDDAAVQAQLLGLNKHWMDRKIEQGKDIFSDLEYKATQRVFEQASDKDSFILVGIFYKEELIAYTLDEILAAGYSIRHFMKADSEYKGIYPYLISEVGRIAFGRGCKYVNVEQDLGLKGLRQSKKSFAPAEFFEKYTVVFA